MAFGSFEAGAGRSTTMAEINMIPLIDVMLVLLVIFIITAPLLTHAVKLDLPKATNTPNLSHPDNIQLAIDGDSKIFWNGEVVDRAGLRERLATAARMDPQPEVHLRADRKTPYEAVAQSLSDSANAGLTRIGFVTDPADAP
ncbi:MAG: biopolymer transporter ExbD [Betaproteobacteria bacterium]|nr:biopolymer transporter ExbD [Betaproteobacteria bacterium]